MRKLRETYPLSGTEGRNRCLPYKNSAATTFDLWFNLRLVVKGPLLGNLLTNSLFI